jgi:dephospho-CoA kinase
MSAWPGKTVIGLTGNIATGKSVVRKMLEHLGAYGIDADALSHRAVAIGAPGYEKVIETFGKWIVNSDGQIDRAKLARIVFSDPHALKQLENIIHPLVRQAEDLLIRRSTQNVIVVEAIKLLESGFGKMCDQVWVTVASPETQYQRLIRKRGMTPETASQRIKAQPPQEEKIKAAQVVIRNDGSFEDTWRQVVAGWKSLMPETHAQPDIAETTGILIQRAKPNQAQEIADLIRQYTNGKRDLSREAIMESFGEKAYLLLRIDGRLRGLVGWRVENLVARVDDVYLDPSLSFEQTAEKMMSEVEFASRELQCEAALMFLDPQMSAYRELWQKLGYRESSIQSLGVRAWQDAAVESLPAGAVLWFKRLREDLVLKPV